MPGNCQDVAKYLFLSTILAVMFAGAIYAQPFDDSVLNDEFLSICPITPDMLHDADPDVRMLLKLTIE